MRRVVLFLFLTMFLSSITVSPHNYESAQAAWPVFVPVLLYHHLAPQAESLHEHNPMVVTCEQFTKQMHYLRDNGYQTIDLAQLQGYLQGSAQLPAKPVMITFDDGYQSFYQYAFPVLEELDMKAVVFVIGALAPDRDGEKTAAWCIHLSWPQMQELAASGRVEFGNHSYDLHRQVEGQPVMLECSAAAIKEDLSRLQSACHAAGLPEPRAFAYPFGAHDAVIRQAAAEAGLCLGFTTEIGWVKPNADPMALARLPVFPWTKLPSLLGG
ncbi:MAG TPA: polysaccharide deacetylase family protein [Firmicutes bacterium]|jgi:peptidoglycan/xylan/chitin deacetylase (PgdA/CDA1 family)|nr:polysaccharide deacetylase family protein [Bacillota bacterium]